MATQRKQTAAVGEAGDSRRFATRTRHAVACGNWTGSRPSRDCGSATQTRTSLAHWHASGQTARLRPNTWATRRFIVLFLQPRRLKPKLVVKGSGIDWLSVSAQWEQEGMKLTAADLQRLAAATSRFVKLPDSGWIELDTEAVQTAHEAMADLGVDGLVPVPQRIGLEQAAHLDEEGLKRFGDSPQAKALRENLKNFKGVPATGLPVQRAGRFASLPERRVRFSLSSRANQARRNSGRRHGAWAKRCKRCVARVVAGTQQEESQALSGDLSGVRAAQLAARSQPFYATT